MTSAPVPLVTSLLVLLLPGVGYLGWLLARTVAPPRQARLLWPVLSLVAWLVCLHVVSYALKSFSIGLVAGTALPAVLGALGWVFRAQLPKFESAEEEARIPGWWLWGGAVVVAALISPAAFGWAFHDEVNLTGHMSIASQIQNGIYPPRHLTMAGFELQYHYGFNTMTAAWATLARIPMSLAIDLLTVLSWAVCWLIASELGARLLGRMGWLLAPLILFGGGLPIVCEPAYEAPLSIWVGGCVVDHAYIAPPLVSFLFQHPWGLGFPLGLALLSISMGRRFSLWTGVLTTLLLVGLALSQLVLFVCLATAIPASQILEVLWKRRNGGSKPCFPWRSIWQPLIPSVVALAIASQLGGMFADSPSGSLLTFRLGPTLTLLGTLEWNLSTFGLFLPLGVLGVVLLAKRGVWLPTWMLGGSMVVLHTVAHQVTWDVVKFAAVAQLALAFGTCEVLLRLLEQRSFLVNRLAPVIAIAVLVHAGIAFCFAFFLGPSVLPTNLLPREHVKLEPDDVSIMEELRSKAQPGDVMYRRRKRVAWGYAQWGGLPQIWTDRQMVAFGFPPALMANRKRLLREWPADVALYRREGLRWLVLDQEDTVLRMHIKNWMTDGKARHFRTVGPLDVVELLDPSP